MTQMMDRSLYQSILSLFRNHRKPHKGTLRSAVTELVSGFLQVMAAVFIFAIGPFAWILRDRHLESTVESVGFEAVSRTFWCFHWGPIVVGLLLLTTSFRSSRR